jgi:hypothetical protein
MLCSSQERVITICIQALSVKRNYGLFPVLRTWVCPSGFAQWKLYVWHVKLVRLTFQFSKQHFAGRDLQTTFEYLILFISDLSSVYTQNQQIDNFKTNKFGRSYISGKPLSEDFRVLIILDTIIEKGGDSLLTGYTPVTYIEIAKRRNVSQSRYK